MLVILAQEAEAEDYTFEYSTDKADLDYIEKLCLHQKEKEFKMYSLLV